MNPIEYVSSPNKPFHDPRADSMRTSRHAEASVTDDGGETDPDVGSAERYHSTTLTRDHNITTGKVYQRVLDAERRGDFLGKTVQVYVAPSRSMSQTGR